jgi:hypothetical protein
MPGYGGMWTATGLAPDGASAQTENPDEGGRGDSIDGARGQHGDQDCV